MTRFQGLLFLGKLYICRPDLFSDLLGFRSRFDHSMEALRPLVERFSKLSGQSFESTGTLFGLILPPEFFKDGARVDGVCGLVGSNPDEGVSQPGPACACPIELTEFFRYRGHFEKRSLPWCNAVKKALMSNQPVPISVDQIITGLKKCEDGGCPVDFAKDVSSGLIIMPRFCPVAVSCRHDDVAVCSQEITKQVTRMEHAAGIMSELTPKLKSMYEKRGGTLAKIKEVFDTVNGAPMDEKLLRVWPPTTPSK